MPTTITHDGVTFEIDQTLTNGNFVTGEPWVLSSQAFNITSISPASTSLNGGVAHGAMKDPLVSESEQSFDGFLAIADGVGLTASNTPYNAALNIDPGITGSPIAIGLNEETTIVKAVRLASATTPNNWQTIEKYVPLHVLSSQPSADAYPPSSSGTTKTIYTRANVDSSVLRNLTMPGSWTPTYASAAALIPKDLGLYGSGGELLRRYRLDAATGSTASNYSADVSVPYTDYLFLLHDDTVSAGDKQAIIDTVIRFGIQIDGLVQRQWSGNAGAGQGLAMAPWYWYTAFLLQDVGMLARVEAWKTQIIDDALWAPVDYVGQPATGKSGSSAQTFFSEHVNVPFYIPDEFGSNHDTRYGVICGSRAFSEIMSIQMLQNGPSGQSGTESLLRGGAFNASNPYAASVANVDRLVTWQPWPEVSWDINARYMDLYPVVQPLSGLVPWSGKPDQFPFIEGTVAPQDAGLSWDITGFDYCTKTKVQTDFRYSLDGIQWVIVADVADVDNVTGLIVGRSHHTGFRIVSDAGAGPWSFNYPHDTPIDSGNDRGVYTTTGTDGAKAPTFTTSPKILVMNYPAWGYPKQYCDCGPNLSAGEVDLACGLGYSDAYPAPTYTFQWKRDGVNIPGATSQAYTRVAADAETTLTCQITASNASGSDVYETAGVVAPAITPLPPTRLIDTDFRGAFAIDYETEISNIATSNANAVLRPTATFEAIDGINYGALTNDKTNPYPSIWLPLKNSAIAGKTYDVSGQFAVEDWTTAGQYFLFRIEEPDETTLFAKQIDQVDYPTPEGDPFLVNFSGTIVVPPGETVLDWRLRLYVQSATGGSAAGDLSITQLTIVDADEQIGGFQAAWSACRATQINQGIN